MAQKLDVHDEMGELLNHTGTMAGKILLQSTRYCAACQKVQRCYIVRWPDGTITKPCIRGCSPVGNNVAQIT